MTISSINAPWLINVQRKCNIVNETMALNFLKELQIVYLIFDIPWQLRKHITHNKSSIIKRLDMLVCNKYLYQRFEDIYINVNCANEWWHVVRWMSLALWYSRFFTTYRDYSNKLWERLIGCHLHVQVSVHVRNVTTVKKWRR